MEKAAAAGDLTEDMTMATPKVPEVLDNRTPGSLIDLVFVLREQRALIEARAELIKASRST